MVRSRRSDSGQNSAGERLLEYKIDTRKKEQRTLRQHCCKCCMVTGLVTLILAFLILLLLFIVLPVTFMLSIDMQRNLLFQRWLDDERHEFTNFRKYSIEGVRNFYVPVYNGQNIQLGVWHIVPLAHIIEAVENDEYNYEDALHNSIQPVVLYFHGTGGNRITNINMYRVLQRYFHVIAFDYRGYGDSSDVDLTEEGIVEDSLQIYKWLRSQTKAPIYVWGHSLGSSLGTQTVERLRKDGIVPMGLFLESPFNNIREEMEYFPITRIFAWLPWFQATVTDPLESNGFVFNTTKYIKSVDCPIMMVHAEDDVVVPIFLAEKLFKTTRATRDDGVQGNVTFHKLLGRFGYGHNKIYEAPELPDYIKTQIKICEAYNKEKK